MKLHSQQLRELLDKLDEAERRSRERFKPGNAVEQVSVTMAMTLLDQGNVSSTGQYRMFTAVHAVPSQIIRFGWDITFSMDAES